MCGTFHFSLITKNLLKRRVVTYFSLKLITVQVEFTVKAKIYVVQLMLTNHLCVS